MHQKTFSALRWRTCRVASCLKFQGNAPQSGGQASICKKCPRIRLLGSSRDINAPWDPQSMRMIVQPCAHLAAHDAIPAEQPGRAWRQARIQKVLQGQQHNRCKGACLYRAHCTPSMQPRCGISYPLAYAYRSCLSCFPAAAALRL